MKFRVPFERKRQPPGTASVVFSMKTDTKQYEVELNVLETAKAYKIYEDLCKHISPRQLDPLEDEVKP